MEILKLGIMGHCVRQFKAQLPQQFLALFGVIEGEGRLYGGGHGPADF